MVSVGTAGTLQRDLKAGDLVMCEAAVRDEGVSHHYLPPGKLATAPLGDDRRAGRGHAARRAMVFRTGTSWTIDAPYRETLDEVRHYQAEGVLCVEMEAAALFAVAGVRGLRLASAFVISDSLAELTRSSHFGSPEVASGLIELYQAALAALTEGVAGAKAGNQGPVRGGSARDVGKKRRCDARHGAWITEGPGWTGHMAQMNVSLSVVRMIKFPWCVPR